jgi:hypothetical protein
MIITAWVRKDFVYEKKAGQDIRVYVIDQGVQVDVRDVSSTCVSIIDTTYSLSENGQEGLLRIR